jgi:hypothetical protein
MDGDHPPVATVNISAYTPRDRSLRISSADTAGGSRPAAHFSAGTDALNFFRQENS